jgi:membrane protease YdiL (CAAX protease family)
MSLCAVSQVPDATFVSVRVGSWMLALAVGLLVQVVLVRRGRRNGWVAVGIALLSVPAWTAILATLPDIVRTFCAQGDLNQVIVPGQVAPPTSRYDLSGQYVASLLSNLGYLGAGAILLWRGKDPGGWRHPTTQRFASSLRGLLPMGMGEARSFVLGAALFPLLALANVALGLLTSGSSVRTGDDSHVFDNITALQVVLLALAAGVGEELVYRGVLQQGTKRLVPGPRWLGLAIGVAVQAVVFAYAHVGYQNLQHLLFAFLFGLLMGLVVEALGIWTTIVLHVLIDFYAFVLSANAPGALLVWLANLVTLLVLGTMAWQAWKGLRAVFTAKAQP